MSQSDSWKTILIALLLLATATMGAWLLYERQHRPAVHVFVNPIDDPQGPRLLGVGLEDPNEAAYDKVTYVSFAAKSLPLSTTQYPIDWTWPAQNPTRTYTIHGCVGVHPDFKLCRVTAKKMTGEEITLCREPKDSANPAGADVALVRGGWVHVGTDFASYDAAAGISMSCFASRDTQLSVWDGAVAKCIEWHFSPPTATDPQKRFQACVRMARADYCGIGDWNTRSDTVIQPYVDDSSGIASCRNGMCLEATWDEKGAVCIGHLRYNGSEVENKGLSRTRNAYDRKATGQCTDHFRNKTMAGAVLVKACSDDTSRTELLRNRSYLNFVYQLDPKVSCEDDPALDPLCAPIGINSDYKRLQ